MSGKTEKIILSNQEGRELLNGKKKKSKYNSTKVTHDEIEFDSKKERDRWVVLCQMEKAGLIRGLTRQVRYDYRIIYAANGNSFEKSGFYRADFVYEELVQGEWRNQTEDSKGFRTAEYRRKAKIIKKLYGIVIKET